MVMLVMKVGMWLNGRQILRKETLMKVHLQRIKPCLKSYMTQNIYTLPLRLWIIILN